MKSLLFLLTLLVCGCLGANEPMLQQLLRVDCDGTIELWGSTPVGMALRFPFARTSFNAIYDVLWGRVTCACPSVTRAEFDRHFSPIPAGLNGLSTSKTAANSCIQTNFPRNLFELDAIKINLPSTCTYSNWLSSGTCGVKYSFPKIDVTAQLGLFSCPNSWFPGFSLTCAGSGCANLMKPCSQTSDCGSPLTCFDVESWIGSPNFADNIFSGLMQIKVYENNTDPSPGCYQAARGSGAKTTSNDIFTNLFSFIGSKAYGLSGTYSSLKVCGLQELVDFTASNFSINNTALSDASLTTSLVTGYSASCLANSSRTNDVNSAFYGMSSTNRVQVTIPGLTTWDGIDSNGVNVFTVSNFIPSPAPVSSSVMLLGQFTCDQNIILPTHNAGFILSKEFTDILQHLAGLLKDLVACRTNPASTDNHVFLSRYGMWNLEFWLRLFDPSAVSFTLPTGADWRGIFTSSQITVHNLPSTCNFNTMKNGLCQLDFTGLKTLLLADITLRFTAQTCSNNPLFASYTLECIGVDCPFFDGLRSCDTTSQCTPGMQCQSILTILETVGAVNASDVNKALNTDFLNLILGSAYNSDLCSAPTWAKMNGFQTVFGASAQNACDGPSQWQSDMQKIFLGTVGSTFQPSGVTSKFQFCLPSNTIYQDNVFETWAQQLVDVNGNDITLGTAFQAATTPTNAPTTASNENNHSGVSFLAPSAFLAIFLSIVISFLLF